MTAQEPDRFREFFDDAFGFGYTGSPETVRAMCLFSHPDMRWGMLLGCETGYITGYPDNMLMFLATYVGASMKEMQADKGDDPDMQRHIAQPMTKLIERSTLPHGTALFLTKNMDKEQRQATLDLVLRHAARAKNPKVIEALLEAGANPNTMGGIAVKYAFDTPQDLQSLRALHKAGAKFLAAAGAFSLPETELRALDLRLTQEETTAKADTFKKQADELTGKVDALKKELDTRPKPPETPPPPPPPAPPTP